jgi:transcriptional repressor NrdR
MSILSGGRQRVIDSRSCEDGSAIRRRRECVVCKRRFTSYERIEERPLLVVKKNGTREQFDRDKLLNGIGRACENALSALNKSNIW